MRADLGGRHGLRVEVPLRGLAPDDAYLVALGRGLHSFGDDAEPEDVSEVRDCRDDGPTAGCGSVVGDEALIDLDRVDRQAAQVAQ